MAELLDFARSLRDSLNTALTPPPTNLYLVPGNEVAWDVCDNGLAWVRFISMRPNSITNCGIDFMRANIGAGVLRCVETMQEDGTSASDVTMNAEAEQMIADANVVREQIEKLTTDFQRITNLSWSSLGPGGGVAGGEWSFELRYAD